MDAGSAARAVDCRLHGNGFWGVIVKSVSDCELQGCEIFGNKCELSAGGGRGGGGACLALQRQAKRGPLLPVQQLFSSLQIATNGWQASSLTTHPPAHPPHIDSSPTGGGVYLGLNGRGRLRLTDCW